MVRLSLEEILEQTRTVCRRQGKTGALKFALNFHAARTPAVILIPLLEGEGGRRINNRGRCFLRQSEARLNNKNSLGM